MFSAICSASLVMNFTNFSAASLCFVFAKTARLMPATMLSTCLPPAGADAGNGIGATPYWSGVIPCDFRLAEAACHISMAAFPVAKSVTDWFAPYSALLEFTILSTAIRSRYRLIPATTPGESNVGLPDESNRSPPYCWPNTNAWWQFSVGLPASSASPQWPFPVSFLPSATSSSQVDGGEVIPAAANCFLL